MLVKLHRYSFAGLGLMPFPPLKEQCYFSGGAPSPPGPVNAGQIYYSLTALWEDIVLTPCAFSSLLSFIAFIFCSSFLNALFSSGLGNQVASCLSSIKKFTLKHCFLYLTHTQKDIKASLVVGHCCSNCHLVFCSISLWEWGLLCVVEKWWAQSRSHVFSCMTVSSHTKNHNKPVIF